MIRVMNLNFGETYGEMYSDGICFLECEGRYAEFAASGAWLGCVY